MSGPHLSDAARRAGPARQRVVAAWPPCAALTPWLKAAVGTTAASLVPLASRPPRARRRRPDRSPRSPRRPDRRGLKPPTPGSVAVSRHSPVAITPRRHLRAGEPSFPAVSLASALCRRRLAEQRRRAVLPPRALRGPAELGHASAAHASHASHGRGPLTHCASGPSVVSAQWHPVKFYYFLIYSIHCKLKKLCRIHLNSENYETNFVGSV
jgi:hypothetical protein